MSNLSMYLSMILRPDASEDEIRWTEREQRQRLGEQAALYPPGHHWVWPPEQEHEIVDHPHYQEDDGRPVGSLKITTTLREILP